MQVVENPKHSSSFSQNTNKQICNSANCLIHGTSMIDRIRDEDLKSLIARQKLHLVLDLDNTLLHSRHLRQLSSHDQKYLTHPWVKHERLYKGQECITKLRPNVRTFLKEASTLFDMSIFTLGNRNYAKQMLDILDPERLYFANSLVITREDCKTPMKKGLDLVLSHERVTLVVDDTKEFWEDNAKNLVSIAPYEFFDDVSSTKMSWSRWQGDESVNYGELARVLRQLKKIHSEFYNIKGSKGEDDYENRDVRDAVDEVRRKFMLIGTKGYFSGIAKSN